MASIIKSASSSPIAFCRTSVHRTRLTNCAKARACAGSSSIQTSASCPICPVLPVNVPITVYGTVCELSRLFFRVNCGCDRKKGTQTGKKGQLTGKKGQFAGCQKRRKPLLHKALRAVLARAREKTRKTRKNQQKPRCRNPACGQLLALLACQGIGHPAGSPTAARRLPFPSSPRGGESGPQAKGRCPWRGFALPPRPRRREPREQGGAALRLLRPAPRQSVGRSRSVKGRCAFRVARVLASLRAAPATLHP